MKEHIHVKRIYDKVEKSDGRRVLVDRLWPRGVSKEEAELTDWAKELTPPRELIAWFHEDREKRFKAFEKKYHTYLKAHTVLIQNIVNTKGTVTLITAVKDIEHSQMPTLIRFFKDCS